MNILQINTTDVGGGAAKGAWKLFEAYQRLGHRSILAVGFKKTEHPLVVEIPGAGSSPRYANLLWKIHGRLQPFEDKLPGAHPTRDLLRTCASGESLTARLRGRENFNFPISHQLLNIVPSRPDIVNCHNLHGGFFDLRLLAPLSLQVPVVLTLHDAWLLSGHCAHSFDCDRWRIGCGQCPNLSTYPSLLRDGTAENWLEKKWVFEQSRLFVVTPSHWLMRKVEQSILEPINCRVIPNGVDLSVFKPGNKEHARNQLGISHEVDMLLYVGSSDPTDSFKDFLTLRDAVVNLPITGERKLLLLCVGEKRLAEHYHHVAIVYKSSVTDEPQMALYYQSADILVHAAKAETFPTVVLEAMACGIPVIATSVGGIPEQVQEGETGLLVPSGDAQALASSIHRLLTDASLRAKLSDQAISRARSLFDLDTQVDTYLSWYSSILAQE